MNEECRRKSRKEDKEGYATNRWKGSKRLRVVAGRGREKTRRGGRKKEEQEHLEQEGKEDEE